MRIAFIGCVDFSCALLERLGEVAEAEISLVITKSTSSANADFCSLEPIAERMEVPCLELSSYEEPRVRQALQDANPDFIFCFGWSHLLSREILAIPRHGAVGYHPTLLPRNRGRHPIIWALALGLEKTGSTFFFMDDGADTGDILEQVEVAIDPSDDAASLYEKLQVCAVNQLETMTRRLAQGDFSAFAQDERQSSTWRRRHRDDGLIDWRMSATSIHNLVRALVTPYPGAECKYGEGRVKVWKTSIVKSSPKDAEPGKVLRREGATFTVKCGEDAICLLAHDFPSIPAKGTCL